MWNLYVFVLIIQTATITLSTHVNSCRLLLIQLEFVSEWSSLTFNISTNIKSIHGSPKNLELDP